MDDGNGEREVRKEEEGEEEVISFSPIPILFLGHVTGWFYFSILTFRLFAVIHKQPHPASTETFYNSIHLRMIALYSQTLSCCSRSCKDCDDTKRCRSGHYSIREK